MRIIEQTIYQFNELSDRAKHHALGKFREQAFQDYYDWEYIFENACDMGEMMGFDLRQRAFTCMDGSAGYAPSIFFSGFWSQGDGACFTSTYRYKAGAHENKELPEELRGIAERLKEMQSLHFYSISAETSHGGRYNHEYSMDIEIRCDCARCESYSPGYEVEQEYKEICADFARWIYRRLEKEYEYQTSDEYLIEMIEANEWEFDEFGALMGVCEADGRQV